MPSMIMHHVRRILHVVQLLGGDAENLRKEVGIDPEQLADPDARLPQPQVVKLWNSAAVATGQETISLRICEIAQSAPPDHVIAYAVLSSKNLGQAYAQASRWTRLIHESVELSIHSEGELTRVRIEHLDGEVSTRHGLDYSLGLANEIGRRGLGAQYKVLKVHLRHGPPADESIYQRVFAAPVEFFQDRYELLLARDLLDLPLPSANQVLAEALGRYLNGITEKLPERADLLARTREGIRELLREGTPKIEAIAKRLSCSSRTLHRRLADKGVSFQDLLDECRRELAMRHLAEGQLPITAIAFHLGFSEVSAFHRAFKRWAGVTPAEYRRDHKVQSPTPTPHADNSAGGNDDRGYDR